MEDDYERRGSGGAVLMILTIILGAMVLYFIKGRYEKYGDSFLAK